MARIRFIDENARQGELDLAKVRPGDVIKFSADFVKRGDDFDATEATPDAFASPSSSSGNGSGSATSSSSGSQRVRAGEVGEVVRADAQGPSLRVRVPCEMMAMGSSITGDAELDVSPTDIMLVVDSRDPRTSHYRITTERTATSLLAVDLEAAVQGLGLAECFARDARIVVASLVKVGERLAARLIAQAGPRAWTEYAIGAGFIRTAAHVSDWMPLILWALNASEHEYPGNGKLTLKNKRHVTWALDQLATDIQSHIPSHALDWNDEDEHDAELVTDIEQLSRMITRSSDEQWLETLPTLNESMHDKSLSREYKRWLGGKVEAPTAEDMARALGYNPPAPWPAYEESQAPAPKPHTLTPTTPTPLESETEPPLNLEDVNELEFEPDAPPSGDAPAEPETAYELEPEPEPEPEPLEFEPEPAPTTAPAIHKTPAAPPKYDVQVFGKPPGEPHGWATPPAAPVPISVYPGFDAQRTVRVWAEPQMIVQNSRTRETGVVVRPQANDKLLVEVDSGRGRGDDRSTAVWDATEVRLSPAWNYPVSKLTGAELADWQKARHERQKRELNKNRTQKESNAKDRTDGARSSRPTRSRTAARC